MRISERYAGVDHGSNRKCHLINGDCHAIMPIMNAKATLDKAGRVIIPKSIRDELRLAPGDSFTLESDGDQVTLRPVRSSSPLRKKRGIWVFHGDRKISAEDTDRALNNIRRERDRELRGSKT